jgi:phosphoglycerate dehydrogenase-like enzyme
MSESAACWQTRIAKQDPSLRLHLIGVGGAGLSAIARVLCELGMQVSGSDRQPSAATEQLARQGVQISIGQRAETLTALAPDQRPDQQRRRRCQPGTSCRRNTGAAGRQT